jgi:3-deoxy-D-manno-octulosonic-acid transferase
VRPVLHALAAAAPHLHLLLTTGTVTSAKIAAERMPAGASHRFVPLDVPRWIARFLDHWQPSAACFVESEIWPNTLAAAANRDIPLALLNGRLSERSYRQWCRVRGFARRLFGAFTLIWARSQPDAARFTALGGLSVSAPGDLKFAAAPLPADPAALSALRCKLAGSPVWIAASLHPGEDATIAEVHARLLAQHPALITILAPRHPSRGAAIAATHPMPRRSANEPPVPGRMYLADTLGELGLFYRVACCAFIGGSLVPHGGQNPLEPARLGCPTAIGPHADNFAQACAVLREAGALADIGTAEDLAVWVARMLSDPAARLAAAAAGTAAAQRWSDLPDRSAKALLALIPAA